MKQFKNKKDWIRYCEKNFVYQHPDYKDCPKGIIFYGQIGNNNDWYDWFKYEGNGTINWDFFDVWEESVPNLQLFTCRICILFEPFVPNLQLVLQYLYCLKHLEQICSELLAGFVFCFKHL